MRRQTLPGKKYLQRIRAEQLELSAMVMASKRLRYSLLPSAITYDKDRVQTSPSDIFTDKMVEACELIDRIDGHAKTLEIHRLEAFEMVRQIENPRYRTVLELYYISYRDDGGLMNWDNVARAMHYSRETIKKTHKRALTAFERIFSEREDK